jgi:hypothetical protein
MPTLVGFREGRAVSVGLCPATRGAVAEPDMAARPLQSDGLNGSDLFEIYDRKHLGAAYSAARVR